jgi:hypothetical protein
MLLFISSLLGSKITKQCVYKSRRTSIGQAQLGFTFLEGIFSFLDSFNIVPFWNKRNDSTIIIEDRCQ